MAVVIATKQGSKTFIVSIAIALVDTALDAITAISRRAISWGTWTYFIARVWENRKCTLALAERIKALDILRQFGVAYGQACVSVKLPRSSQ